MKIEIVNGKVYNDNNAKIAGAAILDCFKEKKEWHRKPLINKCVKSFGLPANELKDTSYNSLFTKCKSLVGSVLTYMINEGYLYLTDKKELVLQKDIRVIIKVEDVTDYIGSLLKKFPLTKKEITQACVKEYKTDKTETLKDDQELENIINKVLKGACKNNILKKENNKYCFTSNTTGLDCKMQNIVNCSCNNLKDSLIKAISLKGGEFFEVLSTKVVTEYFRYKHNQIEISKVTGGSQDNGIDGYITMTDLIGNDNIVLIQAKVRTSCQVTLKEVREFYGAFKSAHGDIGIFTTNSTYHREAVKFAKKLNDLVLIDGNVLFELCKLTHVGIVNKNGIDMLDEDIFINENFNK